VRVKLVTAAQMLELERAATEAGVPEQTLMESAGLAAAQEAWMSVGASEGRAILVLCGPGNNGGDGLVAARHLLGWGAEVHAYLLRPRDEADPVWQETVAAGVPAVSAEEDPGFARLTELLAEASCVLDALLGTGAAATRPIEGPLAELLGRLAAVRAGTARPHLIALDLPTGVEADSGAADPLTVGCDLTITFGHAKVGLAQLPGATLAGRVLPVDIGLPPEASAALPYEQLDFRSVQKTLPARPPDAHKGSFGTVVIAAGSRRYPGAARLAAEAAARSGAGLVAIAAPEAIQPLLVGGLPDAVHEPLPRGEAAADVAAGEVASADGYLDGHAARVLLRALRGGSLRRASALLVGPGISTEHGAPAFVRTLLAGLDEAAADGELGACVIDADALTAVAALPGWAERLALPRVLTPHPGEIARLTRRSTAEVQSTRLATAIEVARETASVVVLKGACTIVAAPDGRAQISDQANPMLATAGTGDVLAGLIAGLLAQGMEPFEAAAVAVYIHGDCARRVAETHGTAAGLAQDLLRTLPEVRGLLEGRTSPGGGIGLPPGLEAGPPMRSDTPPRGGGLW
jgi:hydroxyethylthiazole kinase-like uncharacterized protein yjeF